MSSISNVTSFPCKRKVECEVMGSRPTGCKCNLLIEKKIDPICAQTSNYLWQGDKERSWTMQT